MPFAECAVRKGINGMSEVAQTVLLIGLGALIGYMLTSRFARRDYDEMNKRLDELRIEIRQLPTVEIRPPVDLSPITVMIQTLEYRVAALSRQIKAPRSRAGTTKLRLVRAELFDKEDNPTT